MKKKLLALTLTAAMTVSLAAAEALRNPEQLMQEAQQQHPERHRRMMY